MDIEPGTSSEADKSDTAASCSERKYKGGGTTCCIPTCSSNTKRNPDLSFYRIPTDKKLRKMWLHWIGRANFQPNNYHRVCSKHFVGGKRTCLHNIPTMVQKLMLPTQPKPRTTSKCRNRDITIEESHEIEDIPPTKEDRISELEQLVENLEQTCEKQQKEISNLKRKVEQCSFSTDHIKNNDSDIELYTGFSNYATFKAFYDYLSPACERLQYIGSKNTTKPTESREKCGPMRTLSPEKELFLCLVRLRLGLLERDLANRFNISTSQVSRIWVTWLDFLYRRLRSIPIWPSQSYVRETSPPSFKESYPNTRVIIDCTELFIETPSQPRSQSATFSTYKNHNTGKGLIGIAPRGYLTFVSELYAGNTSDKQLTNDCGILDLLEPGDEVMADRGFEIENDLPPGMSLNIPPLSLVSKHNFHKRMRSKLGKLLNTGFMLRGLSKELKVFVFLNMTCRYLWLLT